MTGTEVLALHALPLYRLLCTCCWQTGQSGAVFLERVL